MRWTYWRSAAVSGTLMLLGGIGLLTVGEVTLPAGIAAVIASTVPLWLIVLDAVFIVRKVPAPTTLLGVALGIAGIVVLARPSDVQHIDLPATFLVLAATIFFAMGSLYGKHSPHSPNAFLTTAQQTLAAGCACAALAIAFGEFNRVQLTGEGIAAVGYLVVFGSVVGLTAYSYALQTMPTVV